MKRSNRLVARSAVALSLAASLTACGTNCFLNDNDSGEQ